MFISYPTESANSLSDEEQVFSMTETGKPDQLDFEIEEVEFDEDFNEPAPRRFHSLSHNNSHESILDVQ
jgi:hypothetical protein